MSRRGRPGRYDKDVKPYLDEIRNAVKSGATVEEVAKAFDLAPSTLFRYQSEHPELKDAFTRGRARIIFDIKAALLKKALGFHYEEEKVVSKKDKDGENVVGVEKIKRYCPPSETAAAMLLRNYDKEWHDNDDMTSTLKQQELELRKAIAESNNFDLEDK